MMKHNFFYVFVVFEIGRRRLFPIENRPNMLKTIEIHIFIVLLPWIWPQAPFSDEYVVNKYKIMKIMRNASKHLHLFKFFDIS